MRNIFRRIVVVEHPILAAERTTRDGTKVLGDMIITEAVAAKDAQIGRGLLIGNCPEDRLISHLCCAVQNALPSKAVVIAPSYARGEEIAETLAAKHDVEVWQATSRGLRGKGNAAAPVQITVPEKLTIVDKRVLTEGYRSAYLHVIDLPVLRDIKGSSSTLIFSRRAHNVARHKAVCHANGIILYLTLWTTEACNWIPRSQLCNMLTVEAWLYVDGRTLRTAAFANRPDEVRIRPDSGRTHQTD